MPSARGPRSGRTSATIGVVVAVALALGGCALGRSGRSGNFVTGPNTATQAAEADIGFDAGLVVSAAVPAELDAYIDAKGDHAAIAVTDRTTGTAVSVNGGRTFQTASIVKFDILATRLYQHQLSGRQLSSTEKSLAFKMITASDNNAASALFGMDGGASGLTAANKVFGLRATQVSSSWGRTHTTPADQIRLLSSVMSPTGPITQANRDYILSLMSQVEPDQRWGVPAAADADTTKVYVKNGWDTMTAYAGLWGDNSIGRLIEPGHDWLVAVMSNYNRTDGAGHNLDGTLATLAVGGLRLEAQLSAAA
jgi:beta-lactamase class A